MATNQELFLLSPAYVRSNEDAPVIIDDGGSMRIKQIIDDPGPDADPVPVLAGLGATPWEATASATFGKFKIVAMDADGDGPSFRARILKEGDHLTVYSAGPRTQRVILQFGGGVVAIKLRGGDDPEVEPKTEADNNRRSRFVVKNAGRIVRITLTRGPVADRKVTEIYNTNAHEDIVYTALYLTKN